MDEPASGDDDLSLIGRVLGGKFAVESLVGRGAMGAVYKARHVDLDEMVAVKVMHRALATDATLSVRFRREAKAMVRLDHPNSVRVFDFGEEPDGLLYLAMELLSGRDLGAILAQDGALAPDRITSLLRQMLAALAAAHDSGIVHRDLKPENIMVLTRKGEDGDDVEVVKVCDFGIATLADTRAEQAASVGRSARLTSQGLVIGTPEYMSPEQGRGEPLDARADLYSAGVILYELLTGELPFNASTAMGIVYKHTSVQPRPPSALRRDVDPQLEAVCLTAMQKDPAQRYQTAREMRAALHPHGVASRLTAPSHIPPPAGEVAAASSPPFHRRPGTETSLEVDLRKHPTPIVNVAVATAPARAAETLVVRPRGRRRAVAMVLGGVVLGAAALVAVVMYGGRREQPTLRGETLAAAAPASVESPVAVPRETREQTTAPPVADREAVAPPSPAPSPTTTSIVKTTRATTTAPSPVASAREPEPVPQPPSTKPTTPPLEVAPTAPPTAPPQPAPPPATTAPLSPPPPAPVEPSFDPSTGTVSIAGVMNEQGARKRDVASAVARVSGRMTACYQAELRTVAAPRTGRGVVHLETDGGGTVLRASASVAFAPGVARCIERAVIGLRIAGIDTGEAVADVALSFQVH